uniref:Lymphocyte antigen 6 family member G6F n=1 Tax=Mandrillus leucophaeus TaxID=9568 RepID=A0A2K5Y1E6_MANLE
MDASPAFCAPSVDWDMSWILMLLLTMGQGVIILALSIVLWRQRVRGAPVRAASIPQFKPEIQVYENIHLARLGKPNAVLQLWWKPQQFLQRSRDHLWRGQTPARPGTDQATWKSYPFPASSPTLRRSPSLQSSGDRVGGRRDLSSPQGLLLGRPVQQRRGKPRGPCMHFGCSSYHPDLSLTRTVERVVGVGVEKGAREQGNKGHPNI